MEELREGAEVEYTRKVAAVKGESLLGLSDYRCLARLLVCMSLVELLVGGAGAKSGLAMLDIHSVQHLNQTLENKSYIAPAHFDT